MQAVRLTSAGLQVDLDCPKPACMPGEALIRVSLAGICSTDLELVKGYFGFEGILGHEFVGCVVECDDPKWIGKRVVSSINFADKSSAEYREYGLEHHPHRTVLGILNRDGAMAEFVCVPTQNLFLVPEEVDDQSAVFTEPLAAALRIAQQIPLNPDQRVCVIGPGRLGMLIGKVLSLHGADVTMAGRSETSLELAQNWGLASELTPNLETSSYHLVVDATGNPAALNEAIRITRPLGCIVLKSTFEGAHQADLTKLVVDEIRLVGSRCGPFAPALRLLKSGRLPVHSLIDDVYPIEQAMQAMKHAASRGVRKILVRCS